MYFWKSFIISLLLANGIDANSISLPALAMGVKNVEHSIALKGFHLTDELGKRRYETQALFPKKRRTLQPLAPRQHIPSFSLDDFIGGWNPIWNDWEFFPPSPDVASSLITLYQNIYSAAVQAAVQPATGLITLTYGAVQIIFEAAEKILQISWEVVEGFAKYMEDFARSGLYMGLFSITLFVLKAGVVYETVNVMLRVALIKADGVPVHNIVGLR